MHTYIYIIHNMCIHWWTIVPCHLTFLCEHNQDKNNAIFCGLLCSVFSKMSLCICLQVLVALVEIAFVWKWIYPQSLLFVDPTLHGFCMKMINTASYDRAWETDAFQDEVLDLAGVNTLLRGTNGNKEQDNMHEQQTMLTNLQIDYTFCVNHNFSIASFLLRRFCYLFTVVSNEPLLTCYQYW